MQSHADQHIFVTGACGAGKSTLAKALSQQLQLPLHRLDDDPGFRQMLQYEPDLNRLTDPQRYAQWQALRQYLVKEAVKLSPPHIIEGTQILTAPELTTGHRRILVDTPLHQIIRQYLARGRAHDAGTSARYADHNPGRLALLLHVSARYEHGRSMKAFERRLPHSGNSLGEIVLSRRSKPGCPSR